MIGRKKEIALLKRLYESNKAQFVAVYGRLEINEVNVIIDLVRSSKFLVTVISQAAVSHIPGIKVITLDHPNTQMEGSFHILKDSYTKRSTKEFLKMLCENKSYNIALLDML